MFDWRYLTSSKVKRNSIANFSRMAIGFPLSIFFTYFVLKKLSLPDYGTWALAFAFFSYFSYSDFGINTAITRFVSLHHAKNDDLTINKIINTSFFFYLTVGLLTTLILLIFRNNIVVLLFKNATASTSLQISVLSWLILMGFLNLCLSGYTSALNGFQRMEITSSIDLVKTVVLTFAGFILISQNPNLNSMVLAFIASILAANLLAVYFCKKVFSRLTFGWRWFDFLLLKDMLKFGLQTQFSATAFFVHFNLDKILVGYFLGVSQVGYLDIASKIINQARQFSSSLISPLMPAAAEKTVIFKNKIMDFYHNSFKYVVSFSGLIFCAVFILSPLVISLILGPRFAPAGLITQILAFGHFVNLATGPSGAILLAQNNQKPIIIGALASIFGNLILSYIGIRIFGLYGSVAGTSLTLLMVGLAFIIISPRYFKNG